MKKSLFLYLLLISLVSNAQDYPGVNVYVLLNKEVKVRQLESKFNYSDFFIDKELNTQIKNYKKIVNSNFKIVSIEPLQDGEISIEYKIELKSDELGVLFFKYYIFGNEKNFPFDVVGGLDYSDGSLCNCIIKKTDKFTGDVTFKMPTYKSKIYLYKVKKGENEKIFLYLKTNGSTLTVKEKGVQILLENGEKISLPDAEINVNVSNDSGYSYTSLIELQPYMIDLLSKYVITDFRLYIFDAVIDDGIIAKEYLKCFTQKK